MSALISIKLACKLPFWEIAQFAYKSGNLLCGRYCGFKSLRVIILPE